MTYLPDAVLAHLRTAADEPDLEGTAYEWRGRLGRGGMGVVHRVYDRRLGRDVALKVLDFAPSEGAESARLAREARILAGLEHPGIVPVHDVGVLADGRAFYAMKLVQGERLDRHAARLGTLGERLRLFGRLCEPVAFAHGRGVVHRDLKPENVMIGPFGEVLVMDWGVARRTESADLGLENDGASASASGTQFGTVVGTPGYMSPEQARGDSALVDQRADVYGLGAVLRFLLAEGATRERVPPPVRAIAARACAERPADRYGSVNELAADVERFLDRRPVAAHRETAIEWIGRWFERYQTAVVLVLAYLVLRMLLLLLRR